MSVELYSRVLWWDAHKHRGLVKFFDIQLTLHEAPGVLDRPVLVDYGEIHAGIATYTQLQPTLGERTRNMEAEEIAAVQRWFARSFAKLLGASLRHARKAVDQRMHG